MRLAKSNLLLVAILLGCTSEKSDQSNREVDESESGEKEIAEFNESIEDEPSVEVVSDFENAEIIFEKRYENISGSLANGDNIDQAIRFYERSARTPETISALLRAYEFKGAFTDISEADRKATYEKAIEIGEKELVKYPDHVALRYYYVSNLARWGQVIGVIQASKNGLVNRIKTQSEEILILDPLFAEAGAQRILGAMHLKVPKIPFILKWPSKERALELLEQAYNSFPANPGNTMLYAEALLEDKQDDEAKKLLEELMSREPRKDRFLEDMSSLAKAKEIYDKEFR
ncbi:MAG: tetratricopeptide repeat protein [Cyclobacteriaceae bacterium]